MINLHVLLVGGATRATEAVAAALAFDPFFVVRGCAAGAEVRAAAVEWRPDLVLLAAPISDMAGTALLAQLRADRRTAPIPVVFLAARMQSRERMRLQRLGAAGVIASPSDPGKLAIELRRFVAVEGVLSSVRDDFLQRLKADASALSVCRRALSAAQLPAALTRINQIAHSLAGAGGIYGFAGITCASAAVADAVRGNLAGRTHMREVAHALDRLLDRIGLA